MDRHDTETDPEVVIVDSPPEPTPSDAFAVTFRAPASGVTLYQPAPRARPRASRAPTDEID